MTRVEQRAEEVSKQDVLNSTERYIEKCDYVQGQKIC